MPPPFTAANKYRPQWVFFTPPGYVDNMFVVPFVLNVLANGVLQRGIPVQLDDDQDFIIRSIMLPDVGAGGGTPALMLMRDAYGNSLQTEPCLGGGFGGRSSGRVNGFPLDQPIFCPASSVLTWDVAVANNSTAAQLVFSDVGVLVGFNLTFGGTIGDSYTLEFVDPGAPNVPLSASVVGTVIELVLATDGASSIVTTWDEAVDFLNTFPATAAVLISGVSEGGAEIAQAFGPDNFANGTDPFVVQIRGEFRGVKRGKGCRT